MKKVEFQINRIEIDLKADGEQIKKNLDILKESMEVIWFNNC